MRISDWSSDVCSSDLDGADRRIVVDDEHGRGHAAAPRARRILRTVASGLPSRAYWTIPPIARTSLSTRASPSPFPSGRPETNGSNSNSAISEGATGPLLTPPRSIGNARPGFYGPASIAPTTRTAGGSRTCGTAWAALARVLYDPAHRAHQFIDQSQPQSLPFGTARNERIEQQFSNIGRRAGAVVDHREFDRQRPPRLVRAGIDRDTLAIGGGEQNPRLGLACHCLARVLEQVDDDLEQRIAVDEHRRQRGIEAFVDRHIAREPRARDAAGMVAQRIDRKRQ